MSLQLKEKYGYWGAIYKDKRDSKVVTIMKLQHRLWILDTGNTLPICRYTHRLKGALSSWLNSFKSYLRSMIDVLGVKQWTLSNSGTSWSYWFPVLISFLSGKNALLYRKYLHNSILLRFLRFVFLMKYLKLKKYVMKNYFPHCHIFRIFLQY